jgi:flagellar basal-body rod modification protein FlgD
MAVDSITQVGAATTSTAVAATGSPKADALGRDVFLQLLVTELQHQDPTQPKDDAQLLAQLAQFSSLEKLSNIESSINTIGQIMVDETQTTVTPAEGS